MSLKTVAALINYGVEGIKFAAIVVWSIGQRKHVSHGAGGDGPLTSVGGATRCYNGLNTPADVLMSWV